MSAMRLALIVAVVGCVGVAQAQSDPCSWLTPAQLTKEFNGPFNPPEKKPAVPVYRGQNPGTKCIYSGQRTVLLTVYVDRSAAEAKSTFDKLIGSYFQVESKPSGLGDEAYFDTRLGLHILKGKTRLFIDTGFSDSTKAHQYSRDIALMVLPNA
jgi:hypothetical protein